MQQRATRLAVGTVRTRSIPIWPPGFHRVYFLSDSSAAQHLLNVLTTVLVCRLKIEQALAQLVYLALEILCLMLQFLSQTGHRKRRKPDGITYMVSI